MVKELKLTNHWTIKLVAVVLLLGILVPALSFMQVDAAQLTSRSVTIDKSYINATDVEWIFGYNMPDTTNTKAGIIYRFCTTPLGTCTVPTGMNLGGDTVTHDAQSGWPTNATNFALVTADTGDCQETTNSTYEICFSRDEAVATGTTGGAVTHTISGITAPSSNQTVYVRVFIYSDDDFQSGDATDEGVVASAFVNQLTVTARVQERLVFCVGTLDANSASDCTDISGTTEDLGAVDFLDVCITGPTNPCTTNNPSDTDASFAMIATNAQEGVLVTYYAEQDTTGGAADHLGALRIPGADCDTVPSSIDQCFNSVGTTQAAIVAGTENFGMTISSVDTSNGGLTTNLTRDADYDGDGTASGGWAWDETGSVDTIATSNSVLDNEMLVIRFAATAALTTPTGQYSVTSTYVATPTF
jgi:hypothetical protein